MAHTVMILGLNDNGSTDAVRGDARTQLGPSG
jgi:hypothetical protein